MGLLQNSLFCNSLFSIVSAQSYKQTLLIYQYSNHKLSFSQTVCLSNNLCNVVFVRLNLQNYSI